MVAPVNGSSPPMSTSPVAYANALTPDALMTYLSTRLGSLDTQIQEIFGNQQNADKIRAAINEVRRLLNSLDEDSNQAKKLEASAATFNTIVAVIDEQIGPLDPNLAYKMKQDLAADGFVLHSDAVAPGKTLEELQASHATGRVPYYLTLNQDPAGSVPNYTGQNNGSRPSGDSVAPVAYDSDAVVNESYPGEPLGGELDPVSYTTAQVERTREYLENTSKELESASQMNMIYLQSLMSARQTAVSLSTNLIAKLTDSTQKIVENIR